MEQKRTFDTLPDVNTRVMGADGNEYQLLRAEPGRATGYVDGPGGSQERLPSYRLSDGSTVEITEAEEGYEMKARVNSTDWPGGLPLHPL